MYRLIVDVDAGSDDAEALMLLLAEERRKGYRIVAITCTYGNTTVDYVCRNVLLTLEALGRTDVPVYKGAACSLMKTAQLNKGWHGVDGFGDVTSQSPTSMIQEENAIAAINRLINENPGIAVMCLGPLTNLALAIRSYPDLSKKIGEFWVMGGNTQAIGNVPDTTSEFNFHQDPEAASIVLNELTCRMVMLPWEPCVDLPISKEWRFSVLGVVKSPLIDLLNTIDKKLYDGSNSWNPCDAILAAAFIDDKVMKATRDVHLTVEVQGVRTRGQCVILGEKPPNIRVIDQVNCDIIKQLFLSVAKKLQDDFNV